MKLLNRHVIMIQRIKPFMLSYGRNKIANIIFSNIDKVVRCDTDGIIVRLKIKIYLGGMKNGYRI
jgi:hypothetical protein